MSLEPPNLPDPVSSTVTADQVAAHATEPRAAHGPVHTHCENCGTELKGAFCHACGQHDFEFHRSFGHVFLEALENFFHFDAKFFRNIVTLLFRPGQLTADFNSGKRASQMPPFRLYLFVSVLFFFLTFLGGANDASFLDSGKNPPATGKAQAETRAQLAAQLEKAARGLPPGAEREKLETALRDLRSGKSSADLVAETFRQLPAAQGEKDRQATMPGGMKVSLNKAKSTDFERYMNERGRYAFDHPHEMKEAFIHAQPKMLLVCLPFFALFTRVLFRKSGQVYLQHLVLALHFHTFIYLFQLVRAGWVGLGDLAHLGGWISFAAALWLTVYPFLMFRRLFALSWRGTIVRTLALALAYSVTLSVAFIGTLMLIFVTL